jgi:hypothetical protein
MATCPPLSSFVRGGLGTFCEVRLSAEFGGFSAATATGRTHQLKYFSSFSNPFLIGEELQNVNAIHSLSVAANEWRRRRSR